MIFRFNILLLFSRISCSFCHLKGVTGYVRQLNWVCSVVENYFRIHLRIINFLKICKSEFERKFDVQNSYFGDGYIFRISFFKLLNIGKFSLEVFNFSLHFSTTLFYLFYLLFLNVFSMSAVLSSPGFLYTTSTRCSSSRV